MRKGGRADENTDRMAGARSICVSDGYLRWRILARMRRFLRPTLRRPFPRRVAMRELLDRKPDAGDWGEPNRK